MSAPYRPGHYPSQDQTTRIPPVRQHQPGPPRAPRPGKPGNNGTNKTREYLLKGLGLLLVAVVSGMLWWLIQQGKTAPAADGGTSSVPKPTTKYQFAKHEQVPAKVVDSNCQEHSYLKVKTFFGSKPCDQLTRLLYVANVEGKKAYSSVALVRMKSPADAQELKALTETSGTGNVSDLVRDGKVKVNGLKSLSKGFAAEVHGTEVVIVETDFEGGSKSADEQVLDDISHDALQLVGELRQ